MDFFKRTRSHPNYVAPQGSLGLSLVTSDGTMTLDEIEHFSAPGVQHSVSVNKWKMDNLSNIKRGLAKIQKAKEFQIPHFYGALWLTKILENGQEIDYGLVSLRVVTDTGVAAIVDAFQNTVELETFKFHGLGTGTNAEAAGDTALQTELTTQYNPDNTRATGTTTEGASANIYRTAATNTVDATAAVTEHGVFTSATSGAGTLLDRSKFSVINLASGDGIQSTYDLTFSSGS